MQEGLLSRYVHREQTVSTKQSTWVHPEGRVDKVP